MGSPQCAFWHLLNIPPEGFLITGRLCRVGDTGDRATPAAPGYGRAGPLSGHPGWLP